MLVYINLVRSCSYLLPVTSAQPHVPHIPTGGGVCRINPSMILVTIHTSYAHRVDPFKPEHPIFPFPAAPGRHHRPTVVLYMSPLSAPPPLTGKKRKKRGGEGGKEWDLILCNVTRRESVPLTQRDGQWLELSSLFPTWKWVTAERREDGKAHNALSNFPRDLTQAFSEKAQSPAACTVRL